MGGEGERDQSNPFSAFCVYRCFKVAAGAAGVAIETAAAAGGSWGGGGGSGWWGGGAGEVTLLLNLVGCVE